MATEATLKQSTQPLWNETAAQRWVLSQERTDAQLEPLGKVAMDALRPLAGQRVLDVGCGAGQTTLELASRVAPGGLAIGLDISEPLLNRARERARTFGEHAPEFVLGDAASVTFETPFDALFSRFGVMFFDEPEQAFANLGRALRPGGGLAFVCWQSLEDNPWANEPLQAVRALTPEQALPNLLEPGQPGPFAFADQKYVSALLRAAEFEHVEVASHRSLLHFGGARTLREAVDYALQIGPAARLSSELDPSQEPLVRRALEAALSPYVSERGVWIPSAVWVVTATRSG